MVALTPDLEKSLERSLQLAAERKHGYATLEHLLLSLLDDPSVTEVLTACRVDIDKLRRDVTEYLDKECDSFVMENAQVHPTAAFQRVVQRAVLHVESLSKDEVTGANLLVSIFAERDSHAVWFLNEQNMTRYDAVNFLGHGGEDPQTATSEFADEEMKARQEAIRRRLDEDRRLRLRERAGYPPFYLIRISGIEAAASIGIHGHEQAARQKLLVSVTLLLNPPPSSGDEIGKVLDYDFVREDVLDLVGNRHFNLQETLCQAILDLCLGQEGVLGAVVQTDKPDVYPGVASVACRMARLGPALDGLPWWSIEV